MTPRNFDKKFAPVSIIVPRNIFCFDIFSPTKVVYPNLLILSYYIEMNLQKGMNFPMIYDVVVIGGGPSGLMAANTAASQGANTLLIEKGNKLGRKLAISGGGRCNVTNVLPEQELIEHIPGNGRFLYSAFSQFNNESIFSFFEGLGVK